MSENNTQPSLETLASNLQAAAYALAEKYAVDYEQLTLTGVSDKDALAIPLNTLIKQLINQGSIEAVMNSSVIRGNQSKAAKLLGFNRATLRRRLNEIA